MKVNQPPERNGMAPEWEEAAGSGAVKSAERTLRVLEALAGTKTRLTLGELSRDLSIPKSSLHGLLRTLAQRQWIRVDESGLRFGLGLRALLVGRAYADTDDVAIEAQQVLDWLAELSQEAVHLGRLDGTDVVYIAKRESPHALRLFSAIGRRLPAHATALGKSLLAGRSDQEVDHLLDWPLARLTPNTVVDRTALLSELDRIRQTGYAIDNEENSLGIRCIAVALATANPPTDAISVSVPLVRFDAGRAAEIVQMLQGAKQRIDAMHGIR